MFPAFLCSHKFGSDVIFHSRPSTLCNPLTLAAGAVRKITALWGLNHQSYQPWSTFSGWWRRDKDALKSITELELGTSEFLYLGVLHLGDSWPLLWHRGLVVLLSKMLQMEQNTGTVLTCWEAFEDLIEVPGGPEQSSLPAGAIAVLGFFAKK